MKTNKRLAKAMERFKADVLAFLTPRGLHKRERTCYDYMLATPIGDLGISIASNHIHCRFEDDFAGMAYLGSKSNSKWNWYYTDTATLEAGAADFEHAIDTLLAFRPTAEFWAKRHAKQAEHDAYWAAAKDQMMRTYRRSCGKLDITITYLEQRSGRAVFHVDMYTTSGGRFVGEIKGEKGEGRTPEDIDTIARRALIAACKAPPKNSPEWKKRNPPLIAAAASEAGNVITRHPQVADPVAA
jgi:hypothetical protein